MPSRTTITSNGRQIHFEMCLESANPESPNKLLAMIQFEGLPELQEQLRSLCREYTNIFSTLVQSLPAQVGPMVIEIDRAKWEVPRNRLLLDIIPLKSHPHADQQAAGSQRHRGIHGQ